MGCSQVCRQMQRRHASHIITTICDTFAFCHIVSRMDWRWRVRLALQRFHLWLGRRRLLGQATSNLQVESNPIKNDTPHSFQALYPALAAAATTTAAAATSTTKAATRTHPTQTLAPRAALSPTSPTSTPISFFKLQYCDVLKILRQALQRGRVWLRRRRLRVRNFEP